MSGTVSGTSEGSVSGIAAGTVVAATASVTTAVSLSEFVAAVFPLAQPEKAEKANIPDKAAAMILSVFLISLPPGSLLSFCRICLILLIIVAKNK